MKISVPSITFLALVLSVTAWEFEKRIRNGETVGNYDYPYVTQLEIGYITVLGIFLPSGGCTGSIISRRVVVTAGHCFDTWKTEKRPAVQLNVRVHPDRVNGGLYEAVHRLTSTGPYTVQVVAGPGEVFVHPDYNPTMTGTSMMTAINSTTDIAVIYLKKEKEMDFLNDKDFIDLPEFGQVPERLDWARVIGFGRTCKDSMCTSTQRYTKQVPQMAWIRMGVKWFSSDNKIQYIEGGGLTEVSPGVQELRGSGAGDSGGPLVCTASILESFNGGRVHALTPYEYLCGVTTAGFSHSESYWLNVTWPNVLGFVRPFLANRVVTPVAPLDIDKTTTLSNMQVGARARVGVPGILKRSINTLIENFYDNY